MFERQLEKRPASMAEIGRELAPFAWIARASSVAGIEGGPGVCDRAVPPQVVHYSS
jgi:hypothetical protein